MFTRLSNFSYGNYQIANLTATEVNVDTQLLIQIQKYENECLQFILGQKLFDELMTNLELDGLYWKVKTDADAKWGKLVNGTSYVDADCDNLSKKWKGLVCKVAKVQDVDVIETLMASYIFFQYSLNTRTVNTGTGEGKLNANNTNQTSAHNKRCDAWNEFVKWTSYGFSSTNVSLYSFLCDNEDLFEEPEFIDLKPVTYYDL